MSNDSERRKELQATRHQERNLLGWRFLFFPRGIFLRCSPLGAVIFVFNISFFFYHSEFPCQTTTKTTQSETKARLGPDAAEN